MILNVLMTSHALKISVWTLAASTTHVVKMQFVRLSAIDQCANVHQTGEACLIWNVTSVGVFFR